MNGLTDNQLKRQDYVDEKIFNLLGDLNLSTEQVDWNIETIADIRDKIRYWLVEYYALMAEQDFYPYIPE